MDGHDQSKPYIEPFVGGGNMIDKVPAEIRFGYDINEYAVAYLDAISRGWLPPRAVSERTYNLVKDCPKSYPKELVGFVGFGCSYGGKFFGGYGRNGSTNPFRKPFQLEAFLSAKKQAPFVSGVLFECRGFDEVSVPCGATVYCDPPYQSTTGYGAEFDHDIFWAWAGALAMRCRVFVSEYTAPPNWLAVWEKNTTSSLTANTGGKIAVERLFKMRGGLK